MENAEKLNLVLESAAKFGYPYAAIEPLRSTTDFIAITIVQIAVYANWEENVYDAYF